MLETLPGEIVGASTEACLLRRFIETATRSSTPVTLLGETGTGKELVAKLIHDGSSCAKGPFLMVDCSLFYERELKRELFGYVASGARGKSRKGLLEFASSGTCYLSRVEELSPGIQACLFELMETGKFVRLGDGKQITSGVRILVSSPKNLSGFVEAGLFDSRLFAQLSKLSFRLPPLRERREDVPAIVEHVSSAYATGHAGLAHPLFSADALLAMQAYPWPGNLDELEKEVVRLLESAAGTIRPEQLAMEISNYWLGQRGDPDVRKVIEELDGYIREFRVLSRLDLSYADLVHAAAGLGLTLEASHRDWTEEL